MGTTFSVVELAAMVKNGELNLSGKTELTSVDELPAGITSLDLSGCTRLKLVDNLPGGIAYLNLRGCTGLTMRVNDITIEL